MEHAQPLLSWCIIGVSSIILLKIFFSIWAVIDRRIHPGKIDNTLESSFRSLKKKKVNVYLNNGNCLSNHRYKKTLFFDSYDVPTPIYLELVDEEENTVIIAGNSIEKIITVS